MAGVNDTERDALRAEVERLRALRQPGKSVLPEVVALRAELAAANALLAECREHLDYIGWGDSYEREPVRAEGGLSDRLDAHLAGRVP